MLKWVFGADTQPFRNGLSQMRKETKEFAGSVRDMIAKAFSLTAIIVGIKKAITAASDLGETLAKASQIFGSYSDDVVGWSKGLAKSFGQSQASALAAATDFGAIFQVIGIGQKEAAGMSKSLVELASDMASFNNTSVEQALEAIGAGLRGESEPLRKYAVLLDDATLKAQAFAMGIHEGSGPLSVNARAMAAYEVIMRQTSAAQGDFARTSEGAANSQRILAAEAENAAARVGGKLLPQYEQFLETLKNTDVGPLADGLGTVFSFLVKVLRSATTTAGASVGALIGIFGSLFTFLREGLMHSSDALLKFVSGDFKGAGESAKKVAGSMKEAFQTAMENIQAAAQTTGEELSNIWDDEGAESGSGEADKAKAKALAAIAETEKKLMEERKKLSEEIAKLEEDARVKQLSLTERLLELEERRKKLAAETASGGDSNDALKSRKALLETEAEIRKLRDQQATEAKRTAEKKAAAEKRSAEEIAKLREEESSLDREARLSAMDDPARLKALAKERAALLADAEKAEAKGDDKGALEARIAAKRLSPEIESLQKAIAEEASKTTLPTLATSSLASVGGGGNATLISSVDLREQKKVDLLAQIAANTARGDTGEARIPTPVS